MGGQRWEREGNFEGRREGGGYASRPPGGGGDRQTTLTTYDTNWNCCKLPTIGFDLITSASKNFRVRRLERTIGEWKGMGLGGGLGQLRGEHKLGLF